MYGNPIAPMAAANRHRKRRRLPSLSQPGSKALLTLIYRNSRQRAI